MDRCKQATSTLPEKPIIKDISRPAPAEKIGEEEEESSNGKAAANIATQVPLLQKTQGASTSDSTTTNVVTLPIEDTSERKSEGKFKHQDLARHFNRYGYGLGGEIN